MKIKRKWLDTSTDKTSYIVYGVDTSFDFTDVTLHIGDNSKSIRLHFNANTKKDIDESLNKLAILAVAIEELKQGIEKIKASNNYGG